MVGDSMTSEPNRRIRLQAPRTGSLRLQPATAPAFYFDPSFKLFCQRAKNWPQVSTLGAMSCFVGQPLALGTLDRNRRSLRVVNAEPLAIIHSEIELGQVPVQVLLIDALIGADKAALE